MPLRGGSKSIPGKNLRPIAGRPLFAWSLEQAVASGSFDEIFVSTDSQEITASVRQTMGDTVTVIERSAETASDSASTESAMLEFQSRVAFDNVCLIQATSPLTRAEDFRAARQMFESQALDSLLTAVESTAFVWTKDATPLNYDPRKRPRRQDFAGNFIENGAFYITSATVLKDQRCRLGGKIGIQPMPAETSVEIDEPADWDVAEQLLLRRRARQQELSLGSIRALVVDVDGTLTDGGMYYGPQGEALKRFDTRDAKGMELLRDQGVLTAVITAENSEVTTARMRKLGIREYYPGVQDKLALLERKAAEWEIRLQEIAYVGDDVGDLECLQQVGASFCPADAVADVRTKAAYICSRAGGAGAVREICDLLLQYRSQS